MTSADVPRTATEGSQGKRIERGRCLTSQVSVSSSSDCSTKALRLFSPCFSLPRGVTISCANSEILPCLRDGSGESACVKAASTANGTSGSSFNRGIFGPLYIRSSDSFAVLPENTLDPVRACLKTTASEKISARSSTSMPSTCSGGM